MISIMKDNNNNLPKIKLWAVAVLIIIWQIAAVIIDQKIFIVSPLEVIKKLYELFFTSSFWLAIGYSFFRITLGFFIGVITAIILAMLSAKYNFIRDLLSPFMLTIKSVPVVSFVILSLIWFSSENLATLICFLMVLPIVYTGVLEGILHTDENLLEMAKVFRMNTIKKIRYIYFFEVFPFFISAIKVSLGLAWKSGIAAEVIGIPNNSIGEHLFNAKIFLDTASLFAWTMVIVIISASFEKLFFFLLNKLFKFMEKA